jgi:hypothetical protein
MHELRKEPRKHLLYYLKIFDYHTQALIGYLVDISHKGFLISTLNPMEPEQPYRLAVEDPCFGQKLVFVAVEAKCRWCKSDAKDGLFVAGFKVDNSMEAFKHLVSTAD